MHPEPPARTLRTGKLGPVDDPAVELHVVARAVVGDSEIVEAELPSATTVPSAPLGTTTWVGMSPPGGALAFIGLATVAAPKGGTGRLATGLHLWVRRPRSAADLAGTFFTPAGMNGYPIRVTPGHRIPFTAKLEATVPSPRDLEQKWSVAFASDLEAHPGAFYRFAAARVRERYAGAKAAEAAVNAARRREGDLVELMDTATGRLSIQEALERDRPLFLEASRKKATIAIGALTPPALTPHPWSELFTALHTSAPEEPFARATPAEFYYVRARTLTALLDVTDAVEEWGEPLADFADGRTEDRGTFARYQTELGLERTAATRILGPELVRDLAVVGSDPYVHEGTDVTLLLHVTNAALFHASVAGMAAKLGADHGGLVETSFVHEGVTVTVGRSADGAVRQHTALVDEVALVSNSAAAVRRVISTVRGKHPRLSDQPDFAYMLARDRDAKDDVLLYLGDAFIGAVVGPKQKVAEARRQLALAELSEPGYASLLYGLVEGKAPKTKDDLLRSRLLARAELAHPDGSAIEWTKETGAHSKWGSPAALEPLIELPEPARVSEPEKKGYESFAREYASIWSERIDPVALRVSDDKGSGRTRLDLELRVLPLLRNDYREFIEMAGSARAVVPDVASGARLVIGIGKDAPLRRELTSDSRRFGLGDRFSLDWVGDYAFLGVADRNELSNAVLAELAEYLEVPPDEPPPRESVVAQLADLPVYAAIQVRSRLAAGVALGVLRELGERESSGLARWGTAASYRDTAVTTVTGREGRASITLYYGLTPDALVLALNESALHLAIDQLLDAPPVALETGKKEDRATGQAVFDVTGQVSSPLYRSLAWGAAAALLDEPNDAPSLAEAVLRGDPDAPADPARARALSRRTFGVVPLTLEGREFTLGPDGVGFPPRGSANAPEWPDVPSPGSPLHRVFSRLVRLRSALSFDVEPGSTAARAFQSLHARVSIELR